MLWAETPAQFQFRNGTPAMNPREDTLRKSIDRPLRRRRLELRPSVERYEDRVVLSAGFSQYPIANSVSMQRFGITATSDGTIWFTDSMGDVGKVTPDGTVSLLPINLFPDRVLGPNEHAVINGITTDQAGNVWVIGGDALGKIAPDGAMTSIKIPGETKGYRITTDQAGNVWFISDNDHVTRYDTSAGAFTTFALPGESHRGTNVGGIVLGPDGNIWVTRWNGAPGNSIDRVTPDGTVTEFPVGQELVGFSGLTGGPDGNLWYVGETWTGGKIGRITTEGNVVEYALPGYAGGITSGPDGNVWFTIYSTGQIGRISPAGEIDLYSAPAGDPALVNPQAITVGPDGALWFTQAGVDRIGRLDPRTATPDGASAPPSTVIDPAPIEAQSAKGKHVAVAQKPISKAQIEVFRHNFLSHHSAMVKSIAQLSRLAGNQKRPAVAANFRAMHQQALNMFAAAYRREFAKWVSRIRATASAGARKP